MKVGDLVRFGEDYPEGHSCGVGVIVERQPAFLGLGDTTRWKVFFAKRFSGWIRTDQLRVI